MRFDPKYLEEGLSTIYVGGDHRGWYLRQATLQFCVTKRVPFEDMGNVNEDPDDDYPDYAEPVAQAVAADPLSLGVLICGSGHGMAIAANKIDGVRAAVCHTEKEVEMARFHNHMNVLCIAADTFDEFELVSLMEEFMNTIPSDEKRHLRRLDKIKRIEQDN